MKLARDVATQHRAAAAFALAFASAAIASLGGVFALDLGSIRLSPLFAPELLPNSTWPAHWLPGAVSAASQQRAAAEQWLHLVLVFGAITIAVACSNAIIGLLSHANERRYETALRSVLGATRGRLGRDLFASAFAHATIGAAAGVPAGIVAAAALRRAWLGSGATPTTFAWALLAFCACLIVAALTARLTVQRFRRRGWLNDALAPEARSIPGFGAEDLRALLNAAQLACAIALTTVSLLVWSYASSTAIATSPATTSASYSAQVALPESAEPTERRRAVREIRAAVRQAGVDAESIASPGALLGIGKMDKVIAHCGQCTRANMYTPLFPVDAQHHVVGSGFFAAAGIDLILGEEFPDQVAGSAQDHADGVVVNRSFARLAFDDPNPVGKRILVGGLGGAWYRVIGVVADVRTHGLQLLEPDPSATGTSLPGYAPAVYFSADTHPPARFDVVVRSSAAPVVLAGFDFRPVTELLARASAPQQWFSRVLSMLGLMLCGAALIGSFTTSMLSVQSRRVEIAVRRALGARRADVWQLVYRSVAGMIGRGVVAGVVLSVALARAVEVFVPGLPAFRLATVVIVTGTFIVIALIAAVLPLRHALRIPPAQAHL